MRYKITVITKIGERVFTETYTCKHVTINMHTEKSESATSLNFEEGTDEYNKPIEYVMYERVYKLIKRRIDD